MKDGQSLNKSHVLEMQKLLERYNKVATANFDDKSEPGLPETQIDPKELAPQIPSTEANEAEIQVHDTE